MVEKQDMNYVQFLVPLILAAVVVRDLSAQLIYYGLNWSRQFQELWDPIVINVHTPI